jgi:hypothetical protein
LIHYGFAFIIFIAEASSLRIRFQLIRCAISRRLTRRATLYAGTYYATPCRQRYFAIIRRHYFDAISIL